MITQGHKQVLASMRLKRVEETLNFYLWFLPLLINRFSRFGAKTAAEHLARRGLYRSAQNMQVLRTNPNKQTTS